MPQARPSSRMVGTRVMGTARSRARASTGGVVSQEDPADLASADGLAELPDAHDLGGILQLAQQIGTSVFRFWAQMGAMSPRGALL